MKKPNLFIRLVSALWSGVDTIRKILHLILLLLVFSVFLGAMAGTAPVMPNQAALVIRPAGLLVEQLEGSAYDRAVEELVGDATAQTLVQDVVDALATAKSDRRIDAVHLDLGGMAGGGLAKLRRVAAAIEDFRESGKPVIASSDFYNQQTFYLAAHADEVYMHPEGVLFLQGYGAYRTYYKDAIDLLRLDWNIFRVGTHKTAVEPFMRMDMSDEARESNQNLIDQLWELYRQGVVRARGLEEGAIQDFTDNLVEHVTAAGGDIAAAARDHGLVDDLLTRKQVRDRLIEIVGVDPDDEDTYRAIQMGGYLEQARLLNGGTAKNENVAVIIAAGDIMFGSQSPGTIGADSTTALLRRALRDDSVKAVVLRVDSPGGSAFASDVIAQEIEALQNAGKPVVASMSSAAASGGYWISVGADRIIASPATITGSIGIYGMFTTYQRTADAIGIATDGVGSTAWAGELRPDREMSDEAKRLFQLIIEDGYDDFVTRVSVYRDIDKEAVDLIAQGKVWTGVDALGHGLIDQLGTYDDAIDAAAGLAGLERGSFGTKIFETELSPTEQLIVDFLATAKRVGIDPSLFVSKPTTLQTLAGRFEEALEPLTRFNDPKGVYAHCLCNFDR